MAIKIERRPNIRGLIDHEFRILKKFHNGVNDIDGFPKTYDRYMVNMNQKNKKGKKEIA